MPKKMSDEEIREIATKRVRAKKGFYSHLTAYIIINLMLVAIWYFTGASGHFWPMWVMLGWGIGLIFNAVATFSKHDTGWETKEIEKEVEKIKKRDS